MEVDTAPCRPYIPPQTPCTMQDLLVMEMDAIDKEELQDIRDDKYRLENQITNSYKESSKRKEAIYSRRQKCVKESFRATIAAQQQQSK